MDRRLLATTVAAAAIGLAFAAPAMAANPPAGMEKCYGVAAVGHNDCASELRNAAAAHSCAGQGTKARDPHDFTYVPAGACAKIDGGKLSAT